MRIASMLGWLSIALVQPLIAHESGAAAGTPELHVTPEAAPAVAAVDAFSAALLAGDRSRITELLDPDVLIQESGSVEHGRTAYLARHAGEDIEFLAGARITLVARTAEASDGLAVVASESTIHAVGKNGPTDLAATETMVLRRRPEGWRIVQVHWSSHRVGQP